MNRNVEIKARIDDWWGLSSRIEAIADSGPTVIRQEDTFFKCEYGRLKLRTQASSGGELIFYQRANMAEPHESRYQIVTIENPDALYEILSRALGVIGTVRKERLLFLVGETRVHLDTVEGLGQFLELEVVLSPSQNESYGRSVAKELMNKLQIRESNLVEGAYIDLLQK